MNEYHVVRTPLTFMDVEYTISVHIPKSLSPKERSDYNNVIQKKIESHLYENHYTMKFYGIDKFSV